VQYWQDGSERGDDEDTYDITEQEFNTDLTDGNLFILSMFINVEESH
jgi:hypothetical protein